MRRYILGILALATAFFYLSVTSFKSSNQEEKILANHSAISTDSIYHNYLVTLYNTISLNRTSLNFSVFEKAITGFYNLKKAGKLSNKSILSIADFDQASTKKRLYIIDLDKKQILMNTWVAHGQRSGADEAVRFSNQNDSFSSSLGFYVTGEVYRGIHGRSLKLDGMDDGFNNNARSRSIVVHGAAYVSEGTINALGRLGRSQGCPAVAQELADEVINTIGDKTVLFINKSEERYTSRYLNEALAASWISDTTRTNTLASM